jgi:hypothetical protein
LSSRGNGIATALKNETKTLRLSAINAKGSPQGHPTAPGPPRGAGPVYGPFLPRAAVYFDGFNFFHAIDDYREGHLKWINLWALSVRLVGKQQDLRRVVWCSAEHPDQDKARRWQAYRDALISVGVHVSKGHFLEDPLREKEGDVSVALHLMMDAFEDAFDIAYLVTADSDQGVTARLFKEKFGKSAKPKRFITVAPPNRSHSKAILKHADDKRTFEKAVLEECLFAERVNDGLGGTILRPPSYAPPSNWMPSRQRKLALLAAASPATAAVLQPRRP